MATALHGAARARAHRSDDPLADRRAADEAGIDCNALADFRAVQSDQNAPDLGALVRATGQSRLKTLRGAALLALLVVVVAALVTLEAVDLVRRANELGQPFAALLAVTLAGFILLLAWALASSVIDYFRVRQHLAAEPLDIAALRRDEGAELESLRRTRDALEAEIAYLGIGLDKNEVDRLAAACTELRSWSSDNTRRWLRHYDGELLAVVDDRVSKRIREEAVIIGLLTAISPRRGLHSILVLWRQLRLVRSIALLYGWRPGVAGTFSLSRTALTNAALAAGFDELAHFAVQTIPGQAIAVAGGAMAAEALANAALTIRLARQAVNSCRPIRNGEASPYSVGLGQVMAEVGAKVKAAAMPVAVG